MQGSSAETETVPFGTRASLATVRYKILAGEKFGEFGEISYFRQNILSQFIGRCIESIQRNTRIRQYIIR